MGSGNNITGVGGEKEEEPGFRGNRTEHGGKALALIISLDDLWEAARQGALSSSGV